MSWQSMQNQHLQAPFTTIKQTIFMHNCQNNQHYKQKSQTYLQWHHRETTPRRRESLTYRVCGNPRASLSVPTSSSQCPPIEEAPSPTSPICIYASAVSVVLIPCTRCIRYREGGILIARVLDCCHVPSIMIYWLVCFCVIGF